MVTLTQVASSSSEKLSKYVVKQWGESPFFIIFFNNLMYLSLTSTSDSH